MIPSSMNKTLLLVFLLSSLYFDSRGQEAIGQWADQLSYRSAEQIVDDGNTLYCASGSGLFSYEKSSGIITRMSKVSGLSDVGVSSLGFVDELSTLIIGYSNGNIDLVNPSGLINLSDIKRSSVIGDKGIYRIIVNGDEAWLATGFGIVVIDIQDVEVKDTYFIAPEEIPLASSTWS